MKRFFIWIADDEMHANKLDGYKVGIDVAVPKGYRKAYQVPLTCIYVYCRTPLNYVMIAIEWTWGMYWKSMSWIPKYIIYRGKWHYSSKNK